MKTSVKDFMTSKNVVVANKDHSFGQVLQFFAQFPVHHIPVVEGNSVVGMISAKDIIKHFYDHLVKHDFSANMEELNGEHPLEKVMTAEPITIGPDAGLDEAAKIFENNRFHSIPVVDDSGVCGIITTKDIAKQIILKK